MNERRLLIGLGLVVAVLAVVLTVVTVSGGGNNNGARALTGPLPSAPLSSGPFPTGPLLTPTTVAAPPTTPRSLPPVTTTAAPTVAMDVPVTGSGAILTAPGAPDVRKEDAPNDCASLVDEGWESLDCKAAAQGPGGLTYLVEVQPMPSAIATRAYIFRERPDGSYQLVLRAEDDSGTHYVASEVEAALVPTSSGPAVIALGFLEDNGNLLAMDVVEPPGIVAAHRDLPDGAVLASPHGLETWSGPTQPGGNVYTHDTLADTGGAWRIVARQLVQSTDVPQDRSLLA
jgi:hypothetical protein